MTCVWGIEMGVATVIFHVILVILQMLLMRRRFECKNLLQVPVGMVFGAFTTTCNTLAVMFPSTDNLIIRLLMCWIATVFVAIGIFFYVPADIMPLAGEGAMLAISTLTGKPFPTVKIAFDVSMVIIFAHHLPDFPARTGQRWYWYDYRGAACRYRAAHDYASVRSLAR